MAKPQLTTDTYTGKLSRLKEDDLKLLGVSGLDVLDELEPFGDSSNDFIEFHIYDLEDNYLDSGKSISIPDDKKLDIGAHLRGLGYERGDYKVVYNFLRRVGGSWNFVLVKKLGKSIYSNSEPRWIDVDGKIYTGESPDTTEELLIKEIPPRKNLLTPWLPSQGLCMIYSKRGLGKTWLALEIAYAVSSGGRFLNWEAEYSQGVLYIDGEMPLSLMQERLSQIENSRGKKIGGLLKILSPDAQEFGIPDLSTREGQEKIDELIGDEIKLVVLDNLSTLIRSGKESESDSWLPVQEWVLRLRSKGKSVLLIHHAGKGGQQRGTSRREDVLDTVIALRKPENYSPDSGTCFEVHFEKNRGLYGDNIKPFEAHLETHLSNDGVKTINWKHKSLDDSTYEKVCRLSIDGLSNTEITQELGIHKSTVSRHINRGKEEGKISQ